MRKAASITPRQARTIRSSSKEVTSSRAAAMRVDLPAARPPVALSIGIEAGLEERHQIRGDSPVVHQGAVRMGSGEGRLRLADVFGDRPQSHNLTPRQLRPQDQRAEPVRLRRTIPDRRHRGLEEFPRACVIESHRSSAGARRPKS